MNSLVSLVSVALLSFGSAAAAATLHETSEYSSVATDPTLVDSGFDAVSGTLTGRDWDYLALGLPGTESSIALSFALADTSIRNGAGFQLYYSYAPFIRGNNSFSPPYNRWATRTVTPSSVSLENWVEGGNTSADFIIDTDPALGSTLFLAIKGTYSTAPSGIGYTVDLPQSSLPSVPLPAGGLLLASALAAVTFLRRRGDE
ncbi:VPLPA-CTERM protein sorting domain-containing protein [Rhodovulum sp. ES.010]|uniref:hypothetical protein n=1 Tax=Rhodovulum sp. ES.010 TaxID=1882821 RepID=UPI00092891E5|nr:hypothetical protein [Rhodovulum sp. ES.010]SIO09067.1 VPLPA-CTERM protein sorting domain-containing protein [Rhodovulum sp. ES.010]